MAANPTIHEAERATDGSGAVLWSSLLTEAEAEQRRRRGGDIVVRGDDKDANRKKAKEIEERLGPVFRENPHARAGRLALPHFHQASRSPAGHSFYEVDSRKARKRP